MNLRLLSVLALVVLPSLVRAEDPILASRLMWAQFVADNAGVQQYQSQIIRVLDKDGKDKAPGKPLSTNAWLVGEWPRYGTQAEWFSKRVFPTGSEGQAIAFEAKGNFNEKQGTIALWVRGTKWDVNTPQVEELISIESPAGKVTFAKTSPKTLSLTGPSGAATSFPIDFDPNRLHGFAITYDGKTVQIYVDGQPKLKEGKEAPPFAMPAGVTQIVIGQRTPGGTTNKWMDNIETYDRPLMLSEVNRLFVEDGRITGRKLMAVTKARHPIKIDGLMDKDEWADAAQVTGLLKLKSCTSLYNFFGPADVASDQSAFWVTYDGDFLYIAHHSSPPERIASQDNLIVAMLKNAISLHDSNVDQDDCVRLSLLKPYPNGDEYKIYINGIGTTYEFNSTYGAPSSQIKGINLGWDPALKQRSLLTRDGWTIEVALPWQDFYFGKPADGTTLHMNLTRNWKQVFQEDHVWCYGERDYTDDTLLALPGGEVFFQGEQGIIVRLNDVGKIPRGMVDFKADLVNQTKADKSLVVKVTSNSGELAHEEKVAVPAGKSVPYQFSKRVVDFRTHEVQLTIADAANGTLYHVTTLPVLRKDRPDIYVRKYRSSEKIKFETNIEFMGQYPLKSASVNLAIRDRKTGKVVFAQKYSGFTSYTPEFEISTTNWPIAKYEAELTFTASGMKPYKATAEYDRVALPEWWDNKIGQELGVPYPWTAMICTNDYIQPWGRQYQFNKKLLPAGILTTGYKGWASVLRSPMRLVVKSAAGETLDSDKVEAQAKWTKATPIRVEGERSIAAKDFSITDELWSEYDGLVWNRLMIQPKGKIVLSSMELETVDEGIHRRHQRLRLLVARHRQAQARRIRQPEHAALARQRRRRHPVVLRDRRLVFREGHQATAPRRNASRRRDLARGDD